MMKMLKELTTAEPMGTLISKTPGRRNWMIATKVIDGKLRIRYAGTMGRGDLFTSCYLSEMVKYHYRWYYFTYKKDSENALAAIMDAMAP